METSILKKIWPEWTLGKRIGSGSYGVVYEAVRSEYGVENHAAIKVISIPASEAEVDSLRAEGLDENATRTHFENIVQDFINEIRVLVSLDGRPNIVNVKDYKVVEKEGEFGWYIFILMELLTPFAEYTCDRTLTEKEVIKLGCDICTALETCEQENIIHRDIKLGNILFHSKSGEFKLGDFGIARKLEWVTGGLSSRCTPKYMAPEVATKTDYDSRVDIYSLGIVLYQLLNGMRIPFQEEKQINSLMDIDNAIRRRNNGERLPAPSDASLAMAEVILRACAFNPEERYASAAEIHEALKAVETGTYTVVGSDKTTPVRTAVQDPDATIAVRKTTAEQSKTDAHHTADTESGRKKKKLNAWKYLIVGFGIVIAVVLFCLLRSCASGETPLKEPESTAYDQTEPTQPVGNEDLVDDQTEPTQPAENENSTNDQRESPATQVTIKVWTPEEDQSGSSSWLTGMEKAFAQEHPEYSITWVNEVCHEGDVYGRFYEQPSDRPDVYMFDSGSLPFLVEAGALSKLRGSARQQVWNDNSQTIVNTVTYLNDEVYGFPVEANTWFMYYNKAVLTEEDVKSLDAILEKVRVLFPWSLGWYSGTFFLANDCSLFGWSGLDTSSGIRFGGEKGYAAARKMVELAEHPNMENAGDGNGKYAFMSRRSGVYFSGAWDYQELYAVLGEDLGVAQLPTVEIDGQQKQMKSLTGSYAVGVNPDCNNEEVAMAFAMFLATPEAQKSRYIETGILPVSDKLKKDRVIANDELAMASLNVVSNTSVVCPSHEGMRSYWTPMGTFGELINSGAIDITNYCEQVDQLERELNSSN